MIKNHRKKTAAFTLVEMLVVAPVVILIIGVIINSMIQMTGEIMATRSAALITSDIQEALNTIENDVVNSGAFLATNNITLTSPQGRNNDTTNFKNADTTYGPAIILNSYATTDNPTKYDIKYIYTKTPNPCDASAVQANSKLMFNVIYFIKDNALWRRVIAPENYQEAGCETAWQTPSCYPGINGSFCKSQDKKMVEGINNDGLEISYYPTPNSTTPNSIATDSAQTDSARQTALGSNKTISVTVTSNMTVAGRDITQTGTIRASSKNNDTAATPQKPIITTQPSSVSKLENETNITFTAQAFDSTSVQWELSTDKGTSWSNVSGATSNTLTLPTINISMDGYLYRAVFTNNVGSVASNYARLSVGNSQWRVVGAVGEPTVFKNGWTNFDSGYNTMAFRKTLSGVVILRGLIDAGTATGGTVIATLPEGYRPTSSGKLLFTTQISANAKGRIDVWSNGDVVCVYCNTSWTSLEGIHFIPENGRYPNIALTPLNGWVNYGSAHAPASYSIDNANRVHLQGYLSPVSVANTASGTVIYKIPNNLLPSQYIHFPAYTSYLNSHISLDYRTGVEGVVSKVQQTTLESVMTQLMYYPASQDSKWTNLSLVNGWSTSNTAGAIPQYTSPQYTKSADGLVSLRGLIKNSGTPVYDTNIATLPAGFRPSARVLSNGVASGMYTRTDILTTGEIRFMTGSSSWTSLDGITFYADQ
ncbi:MAG: immunoglobulin domain-containing protein [Candidatus Saccharimonadales bacterium]